MTVRLSCNDYAWPVLGHRTALAVIRDLGFDGVDIGLFADATHVTLSSVLRGAARRAGELSVHVEQAGLRVSDVFLTSSMELDRLTPTSRIGSDVDDLQAIFRATVEFAAELGSPGVTLLPGVVGDGQSIDEAVSLAADGLAPLVEIGAERGLGVSVEPHIGSCIESPDATQLLLERCPGLMVTLDPSHFAYAGHTATEMAPLAARTRHVQVRPAGPGVMQAKVRDNQVDLGVLFAALGDAGYDGWLASEFVWMEKWGCDEVDNTGETARLRDLMRSLMSEVGW
jgi:sugar phosphate isomerase/epimerase